MIDKTPKQLKFKFALWTREAVKQLIKQELKKELPISTVGHYLKQWQFTSKKPIKRAYERKDEKTQKWLKEEYPKIKRQAKEENADIWWADEREKYAKLYLMFYPRLCIRLLSKKC